MIRRSLKKTIVLMGPVGKEKIIATFDHKNLHQFILNKVGQELSRVSEVCYYPRVADVYRELIHMTRSNESDLKNYGKKNFPPPLSHVVRDPYTILLILIARDFAERGDDAAALSTINLLSLRYYSNLMHKFIKFCNPDYFRTALEKLSHNHLFVTKQTIGQSILYLAQQVYKKYKDGLIAGDSHKIFRLIIDLRNRFNQSIKSFAKHYYNASENKDVTRLTNEDMPEKENQRRKIERAASGMARDVTVYGNVDLDAAREAQRLTNFNRKLSMQYAKGLSSTQYTNELELLTVIFLSSIQPEATKFQYIQHAQKLMAIKQTKRPVYFKKVLIDIHTKITASLGYTDQFEKLSVQSKAIARKFLAFYITILIYNYLQG